MFTYLSEESIFSQFDQAKDAVKRAVVRLMDQHGVFDEIRARAKAEARLPIQELELQVRTLNERIQQLEIENQALKRCVTRMTRKDKKQRIAELDEEGWLPSDIAEQLTSEGEPASPGSVRTALHRMKKTK